MPLVTIPLLGYAPDLDPAAPGVFSYCLGMEPTSRGWQIIRATNSASAVTLGSTSYVIDGMVSNIAAGTEVYHLALYSSTPAKQKLYWNVAGTLTDVSRSSGGDYTAATNWSFAQYGNYTLATNLLDVLQIRDASGSGVFADSAATGIPKAKIAVTWGPPTSPHVMLLHYNDGTEYADGWWQSAHGGPTQTWTADIGTGASKGQLTGAGVIRCGIAFGNNIVAFGDRQMWMGRFTEPPYWVDWQRVSDNIGCVGMYAATVVNGILYWLGEGGLYLFDGGSAPRLMEVPMQKTLRELMSSDSLKRYAQVTSSADGQLLHIGLRASISAANTTWNTVNLANNRVGVSGSSESSLLLNRNFRVTVTAGVVTLKKALPSSGARATVLADLYGFGINYIGSDHEDTKLKGVIPRFASPPLSFSCTDYYGPTMSEALSNTHTAVTVSATPWRADLLKAARWHAPRLYFAQEETDPEIIDVMLDVEKAGRS